MDGDQAPKTRKNTKLIRKREGELYGTQQKKGRNGKERKSAQGVRALRRVKKR